MQNKLVVADLGAAGNLVKNLILLSPDIHWPLQTDRYQTILNQYSTTVNFNNWLPTEYQLRLWKSQYQVDLSDDLDYTLYSKSTLPKLPIVFLNHSAFYQLEQFNEFKKILDTIYVMPNTEFGLIWQIRSYCEKKSVPLLHDFSFETDKTTQINDHIQKHGHESYYCMNIANMKEIVGHRQQMLKQYFDTGSIIALEHLIQGPVDSVVNVLSNALNISLPVEQATAIVDAWRNLHWDPEKTFEWKYYDCVA